MTLSIDLIALLGFLSALNLLYVGILTWWEDWSRLATRLFVGLAFLGAWWAFCVALSFSGLGLAYPRWFMLSQLLSGFLGPLLFLFTLAFLDRMPRWKPVHTLLLLPGLFGTVCLALTVWMPQPSEVEAAYRTVIAAFVGGAPLDRGFLQAHFPWFVPLQLAHTIQLLAFVLASVVVFVWNSRQVACQQDRTVSRALALIYLSMLSGVLLTNVMPLLGHSALWVRLASLLPLPFVFVLWAFLNQRVQTTRRLQNERETLATYLPTRAVEYVLHEDTQGGEGKKMDAAILFADLRGFTTLSEQIDPAILVAWIDRFFTRMGEETLAEQGMVDKLIGDAVLTVFGVPYPLEGAVDHALRAAERMQLALDELNRSHPIAPGVAVRMGIGIHYGSVIAGTVGTTQRTYTVFGDTVNATHRIEGITKKTAHPILLSRAAFDQLPLDAQARGTPLGNFMLRGKQQDMELFGYGQAADGGLRRWASVLARLGTAHHAPHR